MVSLGGGGSKSKQKSQSTQESGTKFNQKFLDELYGYFGKDPSEKPENQPKYITTGFTGSDYTPVEGGDFNRIEQNLYEGTSSKLNRAYSDAVGRQREELSQMGALNSPSQYLEGSARSSLDRGYLENLQAAARDAATTVLGLKQQEAARRTGFDVGEATRRTDYDVGEATRGTGFNERTAQLLYQAFLNKLNLALKAGQYSTGQSTSSGASSGANANLSIFTTGGSSSSRSEEGRAHV